MAKTNLYQAYDKVAQLTFGPIIAQKRDAAAVRIFTDALSNAKTDLAQHPGDYELLQLGEQDEETGQIEAIAPRVVATGAQWAAAQTEASAPDLRLASA